MARRSGRGSPRRLQNEHRNGYEGLTILALAFTGTVLYRARQGQISRTRAAAIAAAVSPLLPPGYHDLAWLQAGASAVFVVVLLICAAITYHLVQAPMQRLARRVIARLDATDSIAPLPTARV
jgi:hypothetical protein